MIISDESQERLCFNCFNDMISEEVGVELDTVPDEIAVADYSGTKRTFIVQQRIYPNGIFIDAAEELDYGYQFAVHGELDCNQAELFQKLVGKVKRGISKRFTEPGMFPNGQRYHSIINGELLGRVDFDKKSPSAPMIVIDGHPYTWEPLGEMVSSYEGFQIQVKFFDMTEDVE